MTTSGNNLRCRSVLRKRDNQMLPHRLILLLQCQKCTALHTRPSQPRLSQELIIPVSPFKFLFSSTLSLFYSSSWLSTFLFATQKKTVENLFVHAFVYAFFTTKWIWPTQYFALRLVFKNCLVDIRCLLYIIFRLFSSSEYVYIQTFYLRYVFYSNRIICTERLAFFDYTEEAICTVLYRLTVYI